MRFEIVPLSASEASGIGQLILVAEDNVINQQVIRRQINALGLACEMVNDGVEALDRYRQGGVALLLTDCDMPNMDGYEWQGRFGRARKVAPITYPSSRLPRMP